MREIKFRAFDEGNKIMHYDFQFIKSGDEGNDWIIFTSDKNKLSDKTSPLQNPYFSQQLKIMQYTGLKDCTGKDIYEGDIVEGFVNIFSTDFAGNDRHGKTLKKGYVYYDLETPSFNINFDDSIDFLTEFENIKILGNIYENKVFGV